tara:strand:- start:1366 stop:1917 length:552 start_codon:yes stop_codon:yes gene_type:complete
MFDFIDDTLSTLTSYLSSKEAPAQVAGNHPIRTLYGKDAINRVVQDEGDVDDVQKYVIVHEGFVDGAYKDTKDITTSGVGQTGKYMDMTFKQTYDIHFQDAQRMIPDLDKMSKERQKAIMSLAYRGDLAKSPTFRDLVNEGKFEEASVELLNHEEYEGYKKNDPGNGIIHRLEEASKFIKGET